MIVVIIGAGPAGLSIGYELTRRGIDFVILEKGQEAGHSFAQYPKNIFFGPWLNNTLPGSRVAWNWRLKRSTQPAYTWYLGEYARHNQLPIQFNCTVNRVDREGEGFRVHTSQGSYACRWLVNCSGYFSTPNLPHYPGQLNSTLTFMHSHDYREAEDLRRKLGRNSGRVLVVGGRLTAGETVLDLHRQGFAVSLSHRRPLKFGPSPWQEALLSPFNWLWERVSLALKLRPDSYPVMAGGPVQKLVRRGQVPTYGAIEEIDGNRVIFTDGRLAEFDAVIWATGYRYTTEHLRGLLSDGPLQLNQEMESSEVPGLFFLGLDGQRTYRSRFLRGIRADARKLGQILDTRRAQEPLPWFAEEHEFDLEKVPALV